VARGRIFPRFHPEVHEQGSAVPQVQPHPSRSTSLADIAGSELDAVVVGSGFGGAMAALEMVGAGMRVAMIERGGWVERGPANWSGEGAFVRTPFYAADSRYDVIDGASWATQNLCTCVGGPSVFYGGASFRFRERDFDAAPEIVGRSGARWPVDYGALEPFYSRADTARAMGLHPFRIPLAINLSAEIGGVCQQCTTCDAFACAVGAKNDVATRVIPTLVARGMTLLPDTVATRLVAEGERIAAVECVDKASGERFLVRASTFVVAAGALATPHLLLASGLDRFNPAGDAVGRYLMRHCNAMTYGFFLRPPNPANEHHKQVAIHDFYFGAREAGAPAGKLGNLQQVMGPNAGLIAHVLPRALGWVAKPAEQLANRLTGLLAIAEDQPRAENRVRADRSTTDAYGLPKMIVEHRYTERDLAARAFLIGKAKQILRRAGAKACVTWDVSTFSHAVGTVRMGEDERAAPLDPSCRFRGLENLYVTDGSVFPTSAGVNPSLTIAANALRVGREIARGAVPSLAAAGTEER
jgi:choline dehydrogenase-like flavoprotein